MRKNDTEGEDKSVHNKHSLEWINKHSFLNLLMPSYHGQFLSIDYVYVVSMRDLHQLLLPNILHA